MPAATDHVIGFDLGGTKMLAAVIDAKDSIVASEKLTTSAQAQPEKIYAEIEQTIRLALQKASLEVSQIAGIGVGSPGPLDIAKGVILDTPNLNLRQFPLKARLEKSFGCKVLVDNDVNVGTYGEFRHGAAKGYRHVVGIFPGTGIGGGLVLDGKLYHGATGAAGEVGHMILMVGGPLCGCGQLGCLEALASKTAMAKDAIGLAANGKSPTVLKLCGTDIREVKSKAFLKAVEAGEKPMIELIERAAEYLGIGMANVVNLLSPEIIVVGGGIVDKLQDLFLKRAADSMRRHAMPFLGKDVKVVAAKLGDFASVLGAASLLRESLTIGETP